MSQTIADEFFLQPCKVYKLITNVDNSIHIGATCNQHLSKKLNEHKQASVKAPREKYTNILIA